MVLNNVQYHKHMFIEYVHHAYKEGNQQNDNTYVTKHILCIVNIGKFLWLY